jgi:hypothetical protein
MAGKVHGVDNYRKTFWETMAVLCRYGHLGLLDAMSMPCSDAYEIGEQILELVSQENKRPDDD